MDWKNAQPGDPALINKIVEEYMCQGKFDHLRRQLLSEVDTKPSYKNVKQRMESTVRSFLVKQKWRPDLNKNQLRDSLKRQILAAPFLRPGVKRIVDQLANRSSMIDLRPDLEVVTRDLLGIKDEPEPMETAQAEPEPAVSPDNYKMVIATEEETPKEEEKALEVEKLSIPAEKPYQTLVTAMEDLAVPFSEDTSEIPSPLVKSEPLEEPMAVDQVTEDLAETELLEDELSAEESDHSIINQMSPISAGTPSSPPSPLPSIGLSLTSNVTPIKRASDFVGKIPKIRKDAEKDSSELKEEKEDRSKRDETSSSHRPRNGVHDDRKDRRRDRSRDKDRKSTRDRSRDKDKKLDERKDDRSKDRERRDKERNDWSKSSSDKDRSRKREEDKSKDRISSRDRDRDRDREKNKDRNSSRDRERNRDSSYSSRSRDRDRNRDKYKSSDRRKERSTDDKSSDRKKDRENKHGSEKNLEKDAEGKNKSKEDDETKIDKEEEREENDDKDKSSEKRQEEELKESQESEKVTENSQVIEQINETNPTKESENAEGQSSEESVKTADEGSQDSSQDSESGKKKVAAKPIFKFSVMTTRSKGKSVAKATRSATSKSSNSKFSNRSKR